MAAKRSKRKPKTATLAEAAAIRKSFNEIRTAHKHLDLLLKKHLRKVSPMFFAI